MITIMVVHSRLALTITVTNSFFDEYYKCSFMFSVIIFLLALLCFCRSSILRGACSAILEIRME